VGTTGIYGFLKGGKYKVTYNGYDSFIGELGSNIIDFINNTTVQEMNKIFDNIIMITSNIMDYGCDWMTDEVLNKKQRIHILNFYKNNETFITFVDQNGQEISDIEYLNLPPHKIMRLFEGDLNYYKQGLDLMLDYQSDLFKEEYTYIINLDTNKLDIYADIYKKDIPFRSCSFEELKINPNELIKKMDDEIEALCNAEFEEDEE
jgi:hypothetical protein